MTQLFLDLDGVLADFHGGYSSLFGSPGDKAMRFEPDWKALDAHGSFFRDLPLMPDAHELLEAVAAHDPIILSGVPPEIPAAAAQKHAWVRQHLGHGVGLICCAARDKYLFGKPGDILVDDWPKYRERWEKMGGHWIAHVSARESLAALKAHLPNVY